jgi:hypothetical protein
VGAAEPIESRIAEELAQPAPRAAQLLTDAILEIHGDAVAAVLFYGSCLRKGTHEGVLDFYVLVDGYRPAYSSVYLAIVNRLVPPNVFFLSRETELGTLRCKYAVISGGDFERGVGPACRIPYLWARFSQPALLTHARDAEARGLAIRCCARAVVTLVQRLIVFLPAHGGVPRFSPAALWREAFRRTFGSELRTESEEMVRANYEADPPRYDALTGLALEQLASEGVIEEVAQRGASFEVHLARGRRLAGRYRWWLERPLGKLLAFVRLFKNATTFGDWVPYILWKIERHTGRPVPVTERQRRHPFLFGWPVLARLIWRRDIF